jgi:hypothetical protein
MARFSQSGKRTLRVADVITDHGSALGKLLQRGSFLMQLQHLLSGFMDPALAAHFQVAATKDHKLVLIAPSASWATLLRMQAPELLGSLHQAGYTEIESIDVRVAPLAEQPVKSRRKRPLSPAAKQALNAMSRLGKDKED